MRNNYFARKRNDKLRSKYLKANFLSSSEYERLFTTHYNNSTEFDNYLNDAEEESKNYLFRHRKLASALGSWRWKGVYQNRSKLIPIIFNQDLRGIDFGGAYGPISTQSYIVDFNDTDIFGRPVKHKGLNDIQFSADYLFSSHTLEHIKELNNVLNDMRSVLKKDADVFLNLPSYTCTRWRNGWHSNKIFNDHQWTFYIDEDKKAINLNLPNMLAIDRLVANHFKIIEAKYVGDNSIFIHAINN
jgi:hypothetical protein